MMILSTLKKLYIFSLRCVAYLYSKVQIGVDTGRKNCVASSPVLLLWAFYQTHHMQLTKKTLFALEFSQDLLQRNC
jgi:hypothetical protein